MLDEHILDNYMKAGSIANKVLEYYSKLVVPGASILDIIEKTEQKITELGAVSACPVTLSSNSIAAHDTATINDPRKISDTDIVKADLAVMIDGCIADTATTICLDPNHKDLKKTAKDAVDSAIKNAKPGTMTSEIGAIIEDIITSAGFQPIRNLTGHKLDIYKLHAGISIPNYDDGRKIEMEEGMVFAIEPFCTTGKGMIKESGSPIIFRYIRGNTRLASARKILDLSKNKFHNMPFSKRWIQMNPLILDNALSNLYNSGIIECYPPLKEVSDGLVAQQEHTVIVADKPIVTTR